METKTAIFDGGPLDGRVQVIYKDQKEYTCREFNGYGKFIEHIYKEDEKVEGHFIYQCKKN
jgi:hypothetical protein